MRTTSYAHVPLARTAARRSEVLVVFSERVAGLGDAQCPPRRLARDVAIGDRPLRIFRMPADAGWHGGARA